MDSALALLAATAASLFAADLWRDYRRRPRPHIAAYGTGMTMFALATWAPHEPNLAILQATESNLSVIQTRLDSLFGIR